MATCSLVYSSGITTNAASYSAVVTNASVGDLIIAIYQAGATTAAPGLSDDKSGTYTLVTTAAFNSTAASMAVFIGNQFITTSSFTLTNTWTGDNADGCNKAIYAINGLTRLGASALKQSIVLNNQASTTPAVTFASNVSSSNPVLGAVGNLSNPANLTPPTGWTEGSDSGYSTPTNGLQTIFTNSSFATATITWGSTSATACAALAVELDTSVLAAGGGHYRTILGVGL